MKEVESKLNWTSLLMIVGGFVFAIIYPQEKLFDVATGLWVTMVGCGLLDRNLIVRTLTRTKNNAGNRPPGNF